MEVDEFEHRIDEIEFGRYVDKAERLFALAHEVPVGFPSRASALIASGEHHLFGRHFDEARECFELAQADGGSGPASPRARLLDLALDEGAVDDARELLRELLGRFRQGEVDVALCDYIGESLEEKEWLREASRWFSLPLTDLEPDDDLTQEERWCLRGRWRVRRRLDLPIDRYDDVVEREQDKEISAKRERLRARGHVRRW